MASNSIRYFIDIEYFYDIKVKEEEVVNVILKNLDLDILDDNYLIKTLNLVKGERDYDVLEVFETMNKEFSKLLEPYYINNPAMQESLFNIYNKHLNYLKELEKGVKK